MELHAIWNRIDQLEQLIMSQAKEIDLLRRVLNTTQVALQNCLASDAKSQLGAHCLLLGPEQQLQQQQHHHQQQQQQQAQRLAMMPAGQSQANGLVSSRQLQQQQSSNSTIYKSFLINPFVHPSSAIPPVAQRIVFGNESGATPTTTTTGARGGPSMRQSFLANGLATNTTANNNNNSINSPLATRTLPANTRWSTGPSLLGTLPADIEPDGDEGPAKRSGRFNFFVELLTCFCPCFGMC